MGAGQVFTGSIGQSLKRTLDNIIDDPHDGLDSKNFAQYKRFCEESMMADNYVDDLEMGGPGLLSAKPEGQEIAVGNLSEGAKTRYIATTYAMKMIVSKEALEDEKYTDVIRAGRRLKRSAVQTTDITATNMLVNGFDTAFPGGDGLPLWSASHTLPDGGTFSNLAAAPAAPSVSALVPIISQIKKMVGHDGIAQGYQAVRILSPTEQWGDWVEILKSSMEPVTNNFATINVIKSEESLSNASLKFWDNTTSSWAVQTDVDNGLQVKWRRKPESESWVDNGGQNLLYSVSMRFDTGWSDPRCSVGVNA